MKHIKIIFILILLAILTGCTTSYNQEIEKKDGESQKTPEKMVINSEHEIEVRELEDAFVVNLVTEAFLRLWRVDISDHNNELDSQFMLNSVPYRYYNKDIDTIEKMSNYLNEVYTEEISNKIIGPKKGKVRNGRIYHEDGEMGTLMRWRDSDIELIKSTETIKTYEFRVPTVDDYFENRIVELVYVDGKGWRVNTTIDY